MNQPGTHGEAESVRHHCGNQERHEEIEILIEEAAPLRGGGGGLEKIRIGRGYR